MSCNALVGQWGEPTTQYALDPDSPLNAPTLRRRRRNGTRFGTRFSRQKRVSRVGNHGTDAPIPL